MNEKQQKEERKKEGKKTEVRLSQKRRQTLGARCHPTTRMVFNLGDQSRACRFLVLENPSIAF